MLMALWVKYPHINSDEWHLHHISFSHSPPYNPEIGRQKAGQLYNIYYYIYLCPRVNPSIQLKWFLEEKK